ncbi:MAG: DUF7594 domain-containing protein, partial [Candidatus Methylomirabilales bacterium]
MVRFVVALMAVAVVASSGASSGAGRALAQEAILSFAPVADATIDSRSPGTNFGATTSLETGASPEKHILMKFFVSGISGRPVGSALLRMYVADGSRSGGTLYWMPNGLWNEQTVTWNNAPAYHRPAAVSLGSVAPGNRYVIDVTPLVRANGALALRFVPSTGDATVYASRESGPELAPQ